MGMITIKRKNRDCLVIPTLVSELRVEECSNKFLSNNFPSDMVVFVKCLNTGEFDLRGKKLQYRIIPQDKIIK